jgi:hypothetical protein
MYDLPSISISRLRATGVIGAETTEFVVRLGDIEQTVGVKERRFPNGGRWSLFCCPSCGRNARVLRLLKGAVVCCRCCTRRGDPAPHPHAECQAACGASDPEVARHARKRSVVAAQAA